MHVELVEDGAGKALILTHDQVNQIELSSARWQKKLRIRQEPLSLKSMGQDNYEVSSSGVAGFVRVGGHSFEVAPKFLNPLTAGPNWRSAIWRFLLFGNGMEYLSDAAGSTTSDGGLADLLAEVFLQSVAVGEVKGYPLGYESMRQRADFMRGRLDQNRLNDLIPFRGWLPVVTRRLTRDVDTNRLLKWAGEELARSVETGHRRKRLLSWCSGLPEISSIPPHISRLHRPERQYLHLAPAFDVARVLLQDARGDYSQGALDLPGFFWDAEDLFERAMRRLFDIAGRRHGLAAAKRLHALLSYTEATETKETGTTPDIDVHRSGITQMILDAKYKRFNGAPLSSDTYQVLAAGRVTGIPLVALVYPHSGSGIVEKAFAPSGNGLPDELVTLQIGLESFASQASLRQLQGDAASWLGQHVTVPHTSP